MKKLTLASWENRFWAWVIDIVVIAVILSLINIPVFFFGSINMKYWIWGVNSIIGFFYWTILEGHYGQSVGKRILNLKVIKKNGRKVNLPEASVQSFGKAFLLPLDCLIGWLAMPGQKLRLFNKASNTIVIREKEKMPNGIRYVKGK